MTTKLEIHDLLVRVLEVAEDDLDRVQIKTWGLQSFLADHLSNSENMDLENIGLFIVIKSGLIL